MNQPISAQHPAVVLRSHYQHMRAVLAVALIAVVALAAAVVVLATHTTRSTTASNNPAPVSAPAPAGSTRYDSGPEEGTSGPNAAQISPSTRYDGGPEEGTR